MKILCINCGIATNRSNAIGRRILDNEKVLAIVREWVVHQTVSENNIICTACWNHAHQASQNGNRPERSYAGHRRVCILCGRSLLRRIRFHQLGSNSAQAHRVCEVIREWIAPRPMSVSSVACHSCWLRADQASHDSDCSPSTSGAESVADASSSVSSSPVRQRTEMVAKIVLPDYFRPVVTERRCFVDRCGRVERNRVSLSMRKQLLRMYKYYVPPNNRVCDLHLSCTSWDFLNNNTENIINSFNAKHIQDMLSLKDVD